MQNSTISKDYLSFIEELKSHIKNARIRAALSVNKELLQMYWHIGYRILEQQNSQSWGSKIIEKLSLDLRKEFPDIKGLGVSNLHNMRRFAEFYKDPTILQQAAGLLPWYHHVVLLEKVKEETERLWYINKTIENGWSRNVLALQISSRLYEREGRSVTNFRDTLPSPQSDLAQQLLKNPYNLEFISASHETHEREIERMLVHKIKDFLLELGAGFAFVGNQFHLHLDKEDYYLDLLFYHIKLKRYVVVELKSDKFRPEYADKLSFYLNLVDKTLKDDNDNPAIGLILCRAHHKLTVEYSLDTITSPLGVSTYILTDRLPENLEKELPTTKVLSEKIEMLIKESECKSQPKNDQNLSITKNRLEI